MPQSYFSAISDQSRSDVPLTLLYISRTYSRLSLISSPHQGSHHLILQQMTVLVSKLQAAVWQMNHDDPVHIILIAVPCGVRRIFPLGAVHPIVLVLINEIAFCIHPADTQIAAGILFANPLQSVKSCLLAERRLSLLRTLLLQMIHHQLIAKPVVRGQGVQISFTALQHIGNGFRAGGHADLTTTHHHFLVAGQRVPFLRRNIPQEEGAAPILQPLHLMLGSIGIGVVVAHPVLQTITCPVFQNQLLYLCSLTLLLVIL